MSSLFQIDFEDDGEGNRIDFEVGPHKARITSAVNQCSKEGIVHSLTIDGSAVPEQGHVIFAWVMFPAQCTSLQSVIE